MSLDEIVHLIEAKIEEKEQEADSSTSSGEWETGYSQGWQDALIWIQRKVEEMEEGE
jgi:hypothetical protein